MKSKEYTDAKFVKRYAEQYKNTVDSLRRFKEDIENKNFPSEENSYKAGEDIEKSLKSWRKDLGKIKLS
jgi:ketopantoate hydroxymethyltransferase